MAHYEKAVSHLPNHPSATVGLSEILLDIYEQKVSLEPEDPNSLLPNNASPSKDTSSPVPPTGLSPSRDIHPGQPPPTNGTSAAAPATEPQPSASSHLQRCKPAMPEELNRLAARDRAYALLSALTKLGSGWDYAEAWFALSRAYELGGQVDKAKEVLWWTVELEDSRPVRGWEVVGRGGGVL
jgi:cargo-transport protein YPP1